MSDEILKRMSDSYRRIRNTVRFLLGNLAGFDPARDAVPVDGMVALDRWALARTRELQQEIVAAYRSYDFHLIYQKVHNFCVVDLGGFYLDVIKDRLYTTPAPGMPRRSAQTAMYWIAEAMVRWLAPILSFTAEEIWRYMPGRAPSRCSSPPGPSCRWPSADAGRSTGTRVLEARAAVLRELERLRVAGQIGAPLDATVDALRRRRSGRAALGTARRRTALRADHLGGARRTTPASRPADGGACRHRRAERAVAARAPLGRRRSACAAGTSARRRAASPRIRTCAAAASAISTDRARRGAMHEEWTP